MDSVESLNDFTVAQQTQCGRVVSFNGAQKRCPGHGQDSWVGVLQGCCNGRKTEGWRYRQDIGWVIHHTDEEEDRGNWKGGSRLSLGMSVRLKNGFSKLCNYSQRLVNSTGLNRIFQKLAGLDDDNIRVLPWRGLGGSVDEEWKWSSLEIKKKKKKIEKPESSRQLDDVFIY